MIENLTPAQFNRELTARAVKAAYHLAITMNECYWLFWSRNTQVILDSMNENVPLTLERFTANSELGAAVNTQLAKTDIGSRVIVAMPEGYAFNGTAFTYTAPIVDLELEPQQLEE
jgi:hypothetical protein